MGIVRKRIDPRFLDLINYGVCGALSRVIGKDEAAGVFRVAGEIAFTELKKSMDFKGMNPVAVLASIARFLEEAGYMARISLTRVTENEVIIEMYGVSVARSSKRLINEKASPSHFMTNLMFAALKDVCGVKADITDLDFDVPEKGLDHFREKWVLSKSVQ